jgi:uncharacterized protein (DUF697 family)
MEYLRPPQPTQELQVSKFSTNPVLVNSLVGVVLSIAVVFGLHLTDVQNTAIVSAVVTVIAFFTRSKVTPVAKSTGV